MNGILLFLIIIAYAIKVVYCLTTRLEERSKFKAADFKFDLDGAEPSTGGGGGDVRRVFVDQFPALAGEKLALGLFDILPCGVNLPHIHPRASEFVYVIHAESLVVGFVEENGGRGALINQLKTGEVQIIPKGLTHFTQNIGCTTAHLITAFSSEDPGIISISQNEFMLPIQILEAAYHLSKEEILSIKSKLTPSLAIGNEKCLKRCGLA